MAVAESDSILLTTGYTRSGDDGSMVYRLTADGTIESIALRVDEFGGSIDYGTRGSVLSPDGTRLAFVRNGDLFVYDVADDRVRPLTWVAKPAEPPFVAVFVSVKAWSADSRRLVFHVGHALQSGGPACEPPKVKPVIREADYGFHEIDVVTRESRRLDASKQISDCFRQHHVAWLPDGSFLVQAAAPGPDTEVADLCVENPDRLSTFDDPALVRKCLEGDPEAGPLQEFLGVLPEHFANWKLEDKFVALHVRKRLPANWKACIRSSS